MGSEPISNKIRDQASIRIATAEPKKEIMVKERVGEMVGCPTKVVTSDGMKTRIEHDETCERWVIR